MSAQGFVEFCRERYVHEQRYRTLGRCHLLHVPRRPPGSFQEPAVAGISLQISLRSSHGSAQFDFGSGRFSTRLHQPIFVVGPAQTPVALSISDPVELLVLEFPADIFADLGFDQADLGRMHAQASTDPAVLALAQRMWDDATCKVSSLETDALTLGLAALLAGSHSRASAKKNSGGLAPHYVRRVIEYMEDHLAAEVSLADLAALTGLSTFHVCRAFRESTGLPPHRWRLQRRIDRAREMLEGTDLPVTEVAAAVGYDDPSQLAAAFRKALGVSPSQYRRERRL